MDFPVEKIRTRETFCAKNASYSKLQEKRIDFVKLCARAGNGYVEKCMAGARIVASFV